MTTIKDYFRKYKREIIELVGEGPMTNIDIDQICKSHFGKEYIGTFPQDKIPLNKKGYAIINVDREGKPGSHWVALVFSNSHCYIFDSFGRYSSKLLPILIKNLKHKHIIAIDSKHNKEQAENTDICGQLSIAFLMTVEKFGIENVIEII